MSIAALKKLTLAGPIDQKAEVLAHFQNLGCLHVVPISLEVTPPEKAPTRGAEDTYKALRFLADVEGSRKQLRHAADFDVTAFVATVLDLRQSIRETGDRRDALDARIRSLEPWGELVFPDRSALDGVSLWFYELPLKDRDALQHISEPWEIVGHDQKTLFVVVLSVEEPADDLLPVPRVHVGAKPRAALIAELEDTEILLEELQAERIALTRYLKVFREHVSEAETEAELEFAMAQTRDDTDIFVVQGWVPETDIAAIEDYAESAGLAVIEQSPAWNETPPTLLVQPETEAAAVDLAMFYQVPGYRGWDPSLLLVVSFAIFFAMIVADAGYGLVILLGLLAGWSRLDATPKLKAWRRLGLIIAGATVVYGAVVGSYFGAAPPEGSSLGNLIILDLHDFDTMMRLSILIGVAHIVFAIAMNAWVNRAHRSAKAQLGWIGLIVGGLFIWLSGQTGPGFVSGAALFAVGFALIVFFTSERPIEKPSDWAWRIFDGVTALNGAMGAFGDVLSYMRLFALGLASASLALTFNDLAMQVIEASPGIGLLFGLIVLIIGHVLNFGLALMSGVVHGLRLNYIEFFKWGLPEEGVAFRPLTRKEVQK